jgi:hypothetical protein
MATKDLDFGNVIKQVYDPATESLATHVVGDVNVTATNPIPVTSTPAVLSIFTTLEIPFSSIPANASPGFEITPSTSGKVTQINVYDTTGVSTEIRTGAGTGTLLAIIGGGQDQPVTVTVAAGTRFSIRSTGAAPIAGSFVVTLIGI